MNLKLISFLIIFCGSVHSIGHQTLVSKNVYEPSESYSLGEIGQIQVNNDNFYNVSPKLYRKNFGHFIDIWKKIRDFFLKKFHQKKIENSSVKPPSQEMDVPYPSEYESEKPKSEEIYVTNPSEHGDIQYPSDHETEDVDIPNPGVNINADWFKYLSEISELNELMAQDKYAEALEKVKWLTKDLAVLFVDKTVIYVKGKTINEFEGINLEASKKGRKIIFNRKIFDGDLDTEVIKYNGKGSADGIWVRFFKKLNEAITLFKQGKFRELQKTIKNILISYAIDTLKVENSISFTGSIIRRLTKNIKLTFHSIDWVVVNKRYLRFKGFQIFFEAGGPVFYEGKKISESSKKIFSVEPSGGLMVINNILIEKGKFYDF